MTVPKAVKRDLTFYTLASKRATGKRTAADPTFPWGDYLGQLPSHREDWDRAVAAMKPMSFAVLNDFSIPAVAIYRPASKAAFVQRGPDGMSIKDLDIEGGFELMNATAFFFLPSHPGLICMLQGDPATGSPPVKALQEFASYANPQPDGVRWVVQPVHVGAQIEELKRATHVDQLRVKQMTSNSKDVMAALPGFEKWTGFRGVADYFARRIGDEVEVSFSVKLPPGMRSEENRRAFHRIVVEAAGSELHEAKASVRARTVSGAEVSEETLTLARHELASKIEIELAEGEPVRFSKLVEEAARDLAANGEKYAELASGGSQDEERTGSSRD